MACPLGSTCGPGQAPEQGGFIRFFSDFGGNALLDPSPGFCGKIERLAEVEEENPGGTVAIAHHSDLKASDVIERNFNLLPVDEEASRIEFKVSVVNPDEDEGFENEMESEEGAHGEDRAHDRKAHISRGREESCDHHCGAGEEKEEANQASRSQFRLHDG